MTTEGANHDRATAGSPNLSGYLADLQEETIKITAVFVGVVGYLWAFYNLWTVYVDRYRSIPLSAWIGGWTLALTSVASFILGKRHRRANAYLLTGAILAATVAGVLALSSPAFCMCS